MTLKLTVRIPKQQPVTRVAEDGEILVGRAPECGIVLHDSSVSRRHARLFLRDGHWWIEDLGSRNGTALDGSPVQGAMPLKAGVRVLLGDSEIEVLSVAGTEQLPAEEPPSGKHTRLISAKTLLEASLEVPPLPVEAPAEPYRRMAERLKLLTDVHGALGRSGSLEELFEMILDRVFLHLGPEQAAIYLAEEGGGYRCAASRSAEEERGAVLYSRSLLAEVAGKGMAALVLDAQTDSRFSEAQSLVTSGVRSLAAAPLLDPEEGSRGMIVIGSRLHRRRFEEGDLEVLASLASIAAMRIRNLRLAEEAAERRRLEREIALARRIQKVLLPERLPAVSGWSFWGRTIPSKGVSGDMFTVVEREDGRVAVLVADVSGKGIGAALLTASLEALAALPIREADSPGRILGAVGRLLHDRTPLEKFATAFLGVLDPIAGTLTWANAGHLPALVLSPGGGCRMLDATGKPLGLFREETYGENVERIAPGETVVLYTDGFTEAASGEEEFGVDRLATICVDHADRDPAVLAAAVDTALEAFAGEGVFADDRTLVILRREA